MRPKTRRNYLFISRFFCKKKKEREANWNENTNGRVSTIMGPSNIEIRISFECRRHLGVLRGRNEEKQSGPIDLGSIYLNFGNYSSFFVCFVFHFLVINPSTAGRNFDRYDYHHHRHFEKRRKKNKREITRDAALHEEKQETTTRIGGEKRKKKILDLKKRKRKKVLLKWGTL